MKKPRVLKSWSKLNVPTDLWPDILSRLPVKSVLRFRCVSKSWRSMIDDPDFCRLHLHNFKNNVSETHLLDIRDPEIENAGTCELRSSSTFRRIGSFDTSSLGNHWEVVSSVDGLLMLQYYNTTAKELVLWNPSIRKFRALPHSSTVPGATENLDLGFGFDPSIKDYKHVRLFLKDADIVHSIAVYTVGTSTWKTTELRGEVIYDWPSTFIYGEQVQTVCYRGILYFIATKQNRVDKELVSFDLSPEEGRVWVLQGSGASIDSMYWTRHGYYDCPSSCEGRVINPRLFCLRKNRDLLLRSKTGEWVLSAFEASEGKILQKYTHRRYVSTICGYVESLVLRDGCDLSNPKNEIGYSP